MGIATQNQSYYGKTAILYCKLISPSKGHHQCSEIQQKTVRIRNENKIIEV